MYIRSAREVEEGRGEYNGRRIRTSYGQQLALREELILIVAALAGLRIDSFEQPVEEVPSNITIGLGILLQFLFIPDSVFEALPNKILPVYDYWW